MLHSNLRSYLLPLLLLAGCNGPGSRPAPVSGPVVVPAKPEGQAYLVAERDQVTRKELHGIEWDGVKTYSHQGAGMPVSAGVDPYNSEYACIAYEQALAISDLTGGAVAWTPRHATGQVHSVSVRGDWIAIVSGTHTLTLLRSSTGEVERGPLDLSALLEAAGLDWIDHAVALSRDECLIVASEGGAFAGGRVTSSIISLADDGKARVVPTTIPDLHFVSDACEYDRQVYVAGTFLESRNAGSTLNAVVRVVAIDLEDNRSRLLWELRLRERENLEVREIAVGPGALAVLASDGRVFAFPLLEDGVTLGPQVDLRLPGAASVAVVSAHELAFVQTGGDEGTRSNLRQWRDKPAQ